jgi:hypothetical protein
VNGVVRPDHEELPHFRSIERLRAAGDHGVDWNAMCASGGRSGNIQLRYDDRRRRREAKEATKAKQKKRERGGGAGGGGEKRGGSWRGRGKRGRS